MPVHVLQRPSRPFACVAHASMGRTRQFCSRAQPPLRSSFQNPAPACGANKSVAIAMVSACGQTIWQLCLVSRTCFGIFVVWLRVPSSQQRATAAAACLSWCYVTYPITQCTSTLASCIRMLALHTGQGGGVLWVGFDSSGTSLTG